MFSKITSILAFVIFIQLFRVDAVPVDKFYPFGSEHGDTTLPKYARDTVSPEISLRVPVKFYGYDYNSLYVTGNGLISFLIALPEFIPLQFPLSYPVVAALYANVDSRGSGQVFYRETSDASLLARANNEIHQAFPLSVSSFRATSLFVVTWYQVSASIRNDKKNTFQVVFASNGIESFTEFLYADDGIQWIQGEGAPGTGTLGAIAQAGLAAYDGRSHILRGSGTDQIRHLTRLSNFNEAGVWIFRSGDIGKEANVEEPDERQIISQQVAVNQGEMSCSTAFSLCHSQATCTDMNQKFCCTCRRGFYGNGFNCLKEGVPLRANGKVNVNVNGVHLTNQDLQVYIVPNDGRVYAAISKIPQSIGNSLQIIYPVTAMLNWLFAIPTSSGLNGFQITGGILEHSADIVYKNTTDKLSITQKFFGMFDNLKLEIQIQGRIPTEVFEKLEIDDYQMQFNYIAPGLFRSSSSSITYRTTSPITRESVERQISLEQTIKFNESCALDFNSVQSGGLRGQFSYYRVKTARTFISYEGPENILRFAATSKVSLLTENDDPCIEGRIKCVANSSCVVEGDTFRCLCNPGFQQIYSHHYNEEDNNDFGCLDVNECAEGKANCNENAMCVNEIGSYHCACKTGYTGDGYTCSEIDHPCGSDFSRCNPPNSYCRVPKDYRTCNCTQGYQKTYVDERRIAFVCSEIDECERDACGPYATCRNLPGSYTCECKPGYVGDGHHCQRASRDDCEQNPCSPNAICRSVGDSYTCECKPGYFGNGYQCHRENVSCKTEPNCSPNGECVYNETSKSYVCQCIRGYYGDGYQCQAYGGRPVVPIVCRNSGCWCPPNFVPMGEWCVERSYVSTLPPNVPLSCGILPSMCHSYAMCIHNATVDQYYCACNPGYDGSGHECVEIETSCLQRSDICDPHATCRINGRTGKAGCVCNPQFQGDGFVCNPIEICLMDSDCKQNEECFYNDYTLAYDCRCRRGYTKVPDGSCQSVKSCPKCHPIASCVTDVVTGRGTCQCPPGHLGDGLTVCEKIPPTCNPVDHNCSTFATCDFNVVSASYECHCKRGFVGNGTTCTRVTNCFEVPEICDRNARCVSVSQPYGTYASPLIQCQCNPGYIGNGTYCYEIPPHEGGFLFVNWGPTTLRVPYDTSVTNPGYPIQTEANQIAIGLTIDCQRNRVFWSDYYGQRIKSATFRGKNVITVVEGNITAPEGLALDWLNQAIYWTDSGKKMIEAINLDGTNRRVVISRNLTNPRGIALDPYRRKLFWSDWNRAQPKIEWSNLDGSDRSIFVSGPEVQLPNSVTIDTSNDELCWADAGIKRIMCIGIETRVPRIITANCISPFGLTVSPVRYFWTEKSIGKVGYYDKLTAKSGNITLPATGTGTLYGIVNVPIEC